MSGPEYVKAVAIGIGPTVGGTPEALDVCNALAQWAEVADVSSPRAGTGRLAIVKSCLLARLIYGGEAGPSQTPPWTRTPLPRCVGCGEPTTSRTDDGRAKHVGCPDAPDPASVAAEEALLDGIRAEVSEAVVEGDASDCSSPDCIADAVYEIVRVRVRDWLAARSGPASPGGLDEERLRDEIAASVWGAAHSQTEFACTCDHDASCWPHEEADAVIDAAHLTKEATR